MRTFRLTEPKTSWTSPSPMVRYRSPRAKTDDTPSEAVHRGPRSGGGELILLHEPRTQCWHVPAVSKGTAGEVEIDIVIGTNMLAVSIDCPVISLMQLAEEMKAEVALRQRVGRGLRAKKTSVALNAANSISLTRRLVTRRFIAISRRRCSLFGYLILPAQPVAWQTSIFVDVKNSAVGRSAARHVCLLPEPEDVKMIRSNYHSIEQLFNRPIAEEGSDAAKLQDVRGRLALRQREARLDERQVRLRKRQKNLSLAVFTQ